MIGRRFTRLVVIDHGPVTVAGATYRCRCDCGGTADAQPHHLTSGATRSCGCLKAERMREISRKRTAEAHARNEQRVLAVLDQPQPLRVIAKRAGTRAVRARATLTRLMQRGAVVFDEIGVFRRVA